MNRELPAHHVSGILSFPPSSYNFPTKASSLSSTNDRIFGNFSQDGMWIWLVKGNNLEVFSTNTAERCSSWCLGAAVKDTRTAVTAVVEFRCIADPAPRLVVAADWGSSNGLLCLYDVKMSKIMKAIELPSKITSLDVISTQGGSASDVHSVSKELCHMFGIIAVGTDDGRVYIIDLNLDEENYCNEADPDSITFITQQTHNIMGKRENALCHNQHLCLVLNGDGYYRGYFQYRDQDNTPLESFNADEAAVTALKFFRHVTLLAVGFKFGGVQLWNMSHLNLQYSCPLHDNLSPVIRFAFQEPENDPRNFCYFWAVRGCDDEHSDSLTVASLYSLCFSKKEWIDNYGFLYQGFQSCNLSFEYCLGIDGYSSDESSDVTSRLISCYTIQQADMLAMGRPEMDDTLHNEEWGNNLDYSLCVLAWEAWRDGEEGNSSCYLVLFDVNQWYRAQMPVRANFSGTEFSSFLGIFSLQQAVDQLPTDPMLAVHLSTNSLAKFQSLSNAEEFYFPSSLSFNLSCFAEFGIMKAMYFGCQRAILSEMSVRGPDCIVDPKTLHSFCEHTGLIIAKSVSNKSVPFMREQLLTVALENNMPHFVNSCIQMWCRGEYAHFGCTLKLIFDWSWKKVSQIKTSIDKLCSPLFNCSGQELDQSTLRLLHYYVSQLEILSNIFELLHSQNVPIREQGEQELEQRREVTQLIAMYLKLILWLYVCNLLPEHNEGDAYGENEVAYPVSMLSKTYTTKRQELQNLHSAIGQTDVLMIDGLISEMGSALSHQWEKSWNGLYPPPSFYALLNTYLINTIPMADKHQLMLYVLLDMAAFLSDRQSHLVEKLMKFPAVFSLKFSLMKLTHGFWLLDHYDFEEAISVLLDPMINTVDLLPWHHTRIVKAFLYQGEHQKAMKYCRVRNPPHHTPEEVKLRLTVFLANGLTNDAFHFQRQFRDEGNSEDLLNHFFLGCQQTHTLDALLQLPLCPLEEDALISFLHNSPDQKSQELLVTYFLQKCRPIEAAHLNDKLKSQIMHYDEQRGTSLNALVNGYMQILPDVQKRLLTDFGSQPPSNVLTKREVIRQSQPLSTYVTMKKLRTISHSSLHWTVMDKVNEILSETPSKPCTPVNKRIKENNFWKTDAVPFIGTPIAGSKTGSNETTNVVFATPITHSFSENEFITPSKKSRLLDISAFQSTEKEKRRSLKHLSGEVSSLLQTPPIRRKAPLGCAPVLDERSTFTTPHSILKMRLGGTGASTPLADSPKTSQSYMRSVLEKIAQKEKEDSTQVEQGTDVDGLEEDSSVKQLRFKVPDDVSSPSTFGKWLSPNILSLINLQKKPLTEGISARMECSPRPALHDTVPPKRTENIIPEYTTEKYDSASRIMSPKFKAPHSELFTTYKSKGSSQPALVTVKKETETIIRKKTERIITEENNAPFEQQIEHSDKTYPPKTESDKVDAIKSEAEDAPRVSSDSESKYESYTKEDEKIEYEAEEKMEPEEEKKVEPESFRPEEKTETMEESRSSRKDFWEKPADERLSVSPIKPPGSPDHLEVPKESTPEKRSPRRAKESATKFTELLQSPYETRSRSRSSSKSPSSSHRIEESSHSPMQSKEPPSEQSSTSSSKIVTRSKTKTKSDITTITEGTPLKTTTPQSGRKPKVSSNETSKGKESGEGYFTFSDPKIAGEAEALTPLSEPASPVVPSFVFSPPLTRARARQKRNDESYMSTSSTLLGDTSIRSSIAESMDDKESLSKVDTSQAAKKAQGSKKKMKRPQKMNVLTPSSCVINLISPVTKSEVPSHTTKSQPSFTRHRMTLRKGPFKLRKFAKL